MFTTMTEEEFDLWLQLLFIEEKLLEEVKEIRLDRAALETESKERLEGILKLCRTGR
jgi:hypothetical protein